jgi:hypothetical protein
MYPKEYLVKGGTLHLTVTLPIENLNESKCEKYHVTKNHVAILLQHYTWQHFWFPLLDKNL